MIDTNIIMDVLLERDIFFDDSKRVLSFCEEGIMRGFISASAATDIFYILRKGLGNNEEAYKALGHILNIAKVLTVTNEDVNNAFLKRAKDFEDCLMATIAKANKCDCIVSRNKKDFKGFDIEVYSPEELIKKVENRKTRRRK